MPRSSHCCLHMAQDLQAQVSSASAASTRPPVTVFRRPDHEMPLLPDVRSRQSRVVDIPTGRRGLIPDNTQHSWRDDVGNVSMALAFESRDMAVSTWCRLTLAVEHEPTIWYGTVPSRSSDRVTRQHHLRQAEAIQQQSLPSCNSDNP